MEQPHITMFSPTTIRDWDILPKDVLSARSVLCFKKNYSNKLTDKRLILFTVLDMAMKKLPTPDFDFD
jgi:hypothetical protein